MAGEANMMMLGWMRGFGSLVIILFLAVVKFKLSNLNLNESLTLKQLTTNG